VQRLLLVTKNADGSFTQKTVLPVRFVPLVPGK
jgi:protein-L-isoaspartate O-methyltransferase